MDNNLYFLRIIADALEQKNQTVALKEAVAKIKDLGKKSEYYKGYRQFQLFLDEIQKAITDASSIHESITDELLKETALKVAAGIFEEDLADAEQIINLIHSKPAWKEGFKKLREELSKIEKQYLDFEILLIKNDDCIESFLIGTEPLKKTINNITQGTYTLKLNNGRILWQEELTSKHLIWTEAFPESDLDLAASTDKSKQKATEEFEILKDELTIKIYPGIESGHIEIEKRI